MMSRKSGYVVRNRVATAVSAVSALAQRSGKSSILLVDADPLSSECPLNQIDSHVQTASLCNHSLNPLSLFPIPRIFQHCWINWLTRSSDRFSMSVPQLQFPH